MLLINICHFSYSVCHSEPANAGEESRFFCNDLKTDTSLHSA